jgi:hypothetical protein
MDVAQSWPSAGVAIYGNASQHGRHASGDLPEVPLIASTQEGTDEPTMPIRFGGGTLQSRLPAFVQFVRASRLAGWNGTLSAGTSNGVQAQ